MYCQDNVESYQVKSLPNLTGQAQNMKFSDSEQFVITVHICVEESFVIFKKVPVIVLSVKKKKKNSTCI